MRRTLALTALVTAVIVTPTARSQPSPAAQGGGWRDLLDARATGWRGYQKTSLPDGWKVVDGALTRVGAGGDIVYGAAAFGDFELELEWKIGAKGNSGIFFRATEGTQRIYENAPEIQVLDNIGHPDNKTDLTVAGANYALHPAPRDAVKPVGEWNTVRIVVNGARVQHFMNGRKVVDYELWTPDWEAKVKASKFVEWPSYGRAPRGFIGLQDHGDWVAYRNIRVRTAG